MTPAQDGRVRRSSVTGSTHPFLDVELSSATKSAVASDEGKLAKVSTFVASGNAVAATEGASFALASFGHR